MHKRKNKVLRLLGMLATASLATYSGINAAYALRENNERSGDLYLELQKADQSGVGVTEALTALQLHVNSHMNASPLPQLGDNAPVQLINSYERAKLAESVRVTSERESINSQAIAYCEALYGKSNLVTRTQCVADYSTAHPVVPEKQIVSDLYKYDFVSPIWTPDKAGWLVLVTTVLALALLIQLVTKAVVGTWKK